jgi:undecaprenyl pyrophosphate synthase
MPGEQAQKDAELNRAGKLTKTSLLQRFLYRIYESRLLREVERRPMPRHIGIILDGNRRHARQQRFCKAA